MTIINYDFGFFMKNSNFYVFLILFGKKIHLYSQQIKMLDYN
jgi:hypothetical protein